MCLHPYECTGQTETLRLGGPGVTATGATGHGVSWFRRQPRASPFLSRNHRFDSGFPPYSRASPALRWEVSVLSCIAPGAVQATQSRARDRRQTPRRPRRPGAPRTLLGRAPSRAPPRRRAKPARTPRLPARCPPRLPQLTFPPAVPAEACGEAVSRAGDAGRRAASPTGLTAAWCTRARSPLTLPMAPPHTRDRPEAVGTAAERAGSWPGAPARGGNRGRGSWGPRCSGADLPAFGGMTHTALSGDEAC